MVVTCPATRVLEFSGPDHDEALLPRRSGTLAVCYCAELKSDGSCGVRPSHI